MDGRRIVKVGNTVRRPAGYWTPAVHALLNHLERTGFEHVPRVIADEAESEVLSYVSGEIHDRADDRALVSVAALLRRYHDAVASFTPPPWARWQPTSIPTTGALVCHNDLCLGNVVFRGEGAVGIIDFDFAHPADPLWDLAMAAWHWIPLAANASDWPTRLRLFINGYGVEKQRRKAVLSTIVELVRRMRDNRADNPQAVREFNDALAKLERHWSVLLDALR